VASTTEITVVGGQTFRVDGESREIERAILDAARGSIMQFAWFLDTDSGEGIAVNPEHVVALRAREA
jgi:hypothetical protein